MRSIHVVEELLPMAWQEAVLRCWAEGAPFTTEYDKPGDPKSKDVLAVIHVTNPFDEPRIHRGFPGGLNDLQKYVMEAVHGVHDHWIDLDGKGWKYTYCERLRRYMVPLPNSPRYDQIQNAIDKLREAPHTRRAQAVTWQAWEDFQYDDPPCLQRLWFRVEDGRLNMVAHIRSNDAFKAGFMNMYAFTEIQRRVAQELGVGLGEYVHVADSFHIYGSYFSEFEGFLKLVHDRGNDEVTWNSRHYADVLLDGMNELLDEEDMPGHKREIVLREREELMAYVADSVSKMR